MTIRILNPFDWAPVKSGDMLQLNGDHDRIVKIELNCEAPTRIDLVCHDLEGVEHIKFLGIIQGLDKIEVVADADASMVFSTDGEVWYCTNDGLVTAVVMPDEPSFTKLVGRKNRNEQLEQIIRIQQLGIDRLVMAQEAERIEYERLAQERDALQQSADDQAAADAAEAARLEQAKADASQQPRADDSAAPSAATVPA